jgi:hypothetical protein
VTIWRRSGEEIKEGEVFGKVRLQDGQFHLLA